jgi:uncharacterized protein YvpB
MSEQTDAALRYLDTAMDNLNAGITFLNSAAAQLQHTVDILTGMDSEPVLPHRLSVPWIGQNVKDCNTDDFSNSDCGCAAVAMWLRYLKRVVTVDEVSVATGQPRGFTYTLPAHLVTAAARYDLKITRALNLTFDKIKEQIDNANPLIVLVHYASLPKRYDQNFKAGHWIVVTGYTDDAVIYNDPLWQDAQGENVTLAWAEFDKAMADCTLDGNTARQGLIKL